MSRTVSAVDVLTLKDGTALTSVRTGTPEDLQELSGAQLRAFARLMNRLPPRAFELAKACDCESPDPAAVKELSGIVQTMGGGPGSGGCP